MPDLAAQIPIVQLLGIIRIQNAIARSRSDLDSVMTVVVTEAASLTHATGAVVEIVDGDSLVYRAAWGSIASFVGTRLLRAGSLSGRCITDNIPLASSDTATDERVDRVACQRIGVGSMVCVPLLHEDEPVGVLKVVSDRPHAFTPFTAATLGMLADVIAAAMQQARELEAVIALSLHDGLTGLCNRRAFDRGLGQEMARSKRHAHPLSVAMFDLDGLKVANDTLGHAAGDAILCNAAKAMERVFRAHDSCFRLGGDEFAAILPETGLDGAACAAERYIAEIERVQLGNGTVGVSAGVAQLETADTLADFVARADASLYEHKRANRAARATSESSSRTTRRIRRHR